MNIAKFTQYECFWALMIELSKRQICEFVKPKHTICATAYIIPTMTSVSSSQSTMMGKILPRTLSCKEAPSRDTNDGGRVNEEEWKFLVNEDWKLLNKGYICRGRVL